MLNRLTHNRQPSTIILSTVNENYMQLKESQRISDYLCPGFNPGGFSPFDFQEETWEHIMQSHSGLVNAPTGCGKTFSVFLGAVIDFINENPENYKTKSSNHLRLLWITPLRALAKISAVPWGK